MGGACSTYGERRRAYRFWRGDLREKGNFEDLGVEGKYFKMDFQDLGWDVNWIYISGLEQGQVAGCCECGNELFCPLAVYRYGEYIKANEIGEV